MTTAYAPTDTDDEIEFPSESARMAIAHYTAPVRDLASPSEIHAAMMQLDEAEFLAEIMGSALDKWFYSFKVSGKLVEGVSAKGAHEFARLRAEQGFPIRFPLDGIRYEEASENGEAGVRVFIVAREVRTSQEAIGMAFYPYHNERAIKDRDGNILKIVKEFDKYAGRKAMSVAERNAILRLTPEQVIVAALKGRAQAIARNEALVTERARVAMLARPEAQRTVVAPGAPPKALADPYAPPTAAPAAAPSAAANGLPACPVCGGEMWDNREKRTNPRSPDFKCKNGPRARGEPGCTGVIWPSKAATADAAPAAAAPAAPAAPAATAAPGELPLDDTKPATQRTNALREG
jgi:hypothetical protein